MPSSGFIVPPVHHDGHLRLVETVLSGIPVWRRIFWAQEVLPRTMSTISAKALFGQAEGSSRTSSSVSTTRRSS